MQRKSKILPRAKILSPSLNVNVDEDEMLSKIRDAINAEPLWGIVGYDTSLENLVSSGNSLS